MMIDVIDIRQVGPLRSSVIIAAKRDPDIPWGDHHQIARLDDPVPLVVVGADGWGDLELPPNVDTRFVGFVPEEDLGPLYAGAEVFCYPSEREGYGLPVLEAMAQGTPVVTSAGTATEETAGAAAVLVDPLDIDDIARGISEALARRTELAGRGLARAKWLTWAATASLTAAAYRELAP